MRPTIAAVVGHTSMCDIIWSSTTPAGILPGAHMMPGTRNAPSNDAPFSPRNGVAPASGQASCHAPLSAVMMTMVLGASARIASMTRPMLSVELQHRVRVVAELRLAPECRRWVGRVVHLHEVDVHEEGLIVLGVLLDVRHCRIGLPHVEVGQIIVGDSRDLGGRLAGYTFPLIRFTMSWYSFQYGSLYFGNHG